jgi:hypothetical protein
VSIGRQLSEVAGAQHGWELSKSLGSGERDPEKWQLALYFSLQGPTHRLRCPSVLFLHHWLLPGRGVNV